MKTIGLIGGMSWESTAVYYKTLNQLVNEKLGGAHSCELLMYSVDFDPIKELQHKNEWKKISIEIVDIARKLESAGADMILICANTMHLLADDVKKAVRIPLVHIVDSTAAAIINRGLKKVGLLGTRFTMEYPFYREKLEEYGIDVITPDRMERDAIHEIIYSELINGIVKKSSAEKYKAIVSNLVAKGAEGAILGCTEFSMLVDPKEYSIPLFDTTFLHAADAVEKALS